MQVWAIVLAGIWQGNACPVEMDCIFELKSMVYGIYHIFNDSQCRMHVSRFGGRDTLLQACDPESCLLPQGSTPRKET